METATTATSALLTLPVELLQHVTGYLEPESLIPLRLSCKELDATTLDQFVQACVADQDCWIYSEQRWRRLHSMFTTGARLIKRIQSVWLTVDATEGHPLAKLDIAEPKKSQQLGATEDPSEGLRATQRQAAYCIAENETLACGSTAPDLNLIHAVMFKIKSQSCRLHIDLAGISQTDNQKLKPEPVHQTVLLAAAAMINSINTLCLSPFTCENLDFLLTTFKPMISSALSSAKAFQYDSRGLPQMTGLVPTTYYQKVNEENGLEAAKSILTLIPRLENFEIDLDAVEAAECSVAIAADLILANDLTTLRSLNLITMVLDLDTILSALTRCQATLTDLELTNVHLSAPGGSWRHVWQLLAAMPKLRSLEQEWLRFMTGRVWCFVEFKRELCNNDPLRQNLSTRDKVTEELRLMLEGENQIRRMVE